MMRVVDADLRIAAAAQLAPHHERDDAGQIGLIRQHLQIEHQARVLGNAAGRRPAARPGNSRAPCSSALLNPPLDVADGVEILVHLDAIRGAEPAARSARLSVTESSRLRRAASRCSRRRRDRRVGLAEQPLEHRARIVLHRQRRRAAAPRDRVRVHAARPDVAHAGKR